MSFDQLRSLRHQSASLGQTMPYMVAVASTCSEVTINSFSNIHEKTIIVWGVDQTPHRI